MTDLSTLKSRIADDLSRTDLTSQIANAINDAIAHFQNTPFYFNETRSSTFATVASQSTYTSSDDADIPKFADLDVVVLEDSGGESYDLTPYDIAEMESLLDNSASTGRPYAYLYHAQSFRLYPIPDAVYTVRPIGIIEKDAPATDGESGNVWMTEAFELIRCRAKMYLAVHLLRDDALAQMMVMAEQNALANLNRKSAARMTLHGIRKTTF